MKSHRKWVRRGAVLEVTVATVLAAAIATAGEWKTTGTGNAGAKADRAKSLVATVATPTTLLVPGATGDVALTISNPNGFPVTVRSIVGNGAITSDTTGCPGTVVNYVDQPGQWVVPKKVGTTDGSLDITLSNAASMAPDAPDACQGAAFTIPVSVSTDFLVQYVGVGYNGAIGTSRDGATWTARTSGTTAALQDVAFGGGRWVAVGYSGVIVTSDDGANWTARSSGTTQYLEKVAYNGSQWIAIGWGGTILTSTDGATWTSQTSGSSGILEAVAWNGSTWLVLPRYSGGSALWSTNGVTWTTGTAPAAYMIWDVVWAGNRWVAAGQLNSSSYGFAFVSSDGSTWSSYNVSGNLVNAIMSLDWNGSLFIGANSSPFASSTGYTWSPVSGVSGWVYSVTWAGGQWLLGASTTGSVVWTSPNGATWTSHPATATYDAIAGR